MGTSELAGEGTKRDRILRAALEVCATRGVNAATMDDVAARAGVSKGTLYRFFESKEDLFLATLLGSYEEGLRIVDVGLAPARDARERLGAYLDGLCKVLATVGPRMNVHYQAWGVVANAPVFQRRLYGFLRDFHRERDAELAALIREGQQSGAFRRDVDAAALTLTLNTLVGGLLYRVTFDPDTATPEALRACFDEVVPALLLPTGRAPRG
jgi:AcrR family transcriptional regulator